jgi:GNAT superfamily N-acetyltransferase
MPISLAQSDLRTHYIRDPFAIETIDIDQIVQELAEGSPGSTPSLWVGHTPLTEYDHVVLASDRRSGRCLGVMGARDGVTERDEEFLFIHTGFVAERARGKGLMRRMIALTLLRAAGNDAMPRIIAARTCSRLFYRVLNDFGARIPEVVVYPDLEAGPVSLPAASLAQRIARQVARGTRFEPGTGALRGGLAAAGGGKIPPTLSHDPRIDELFGRTLAPPDQILAMVDMRPASEEAIVEEARRIYRRN